ncbi:MAG: hypothetical protein WBP58_00220 [Chitinophagaceae bacterium]
MKTTAPIRYINSNTSKGYRTKTKVSKPWHIKSRNGNRMPEIELSRKITILKAYLELGEIRFNKWAQYKERRFFKNFKAGINSLELNSEIGREIVRLNEELINSYIPKRSSVYKVSPVAESLSGTELVQRPKSLIF